MQLTAQAGAQGAYVDAGWRYGGGGEVDVGHCLPLSGDRYLLGDDGVVTVFLDPGVEGAGVEEEGHLALAARDEGAGDDVRAGGVGRDPDAGALERTAGDGDAERLLEGAGTTRDAGIEHDAGAAGRLVVGDGLVPDGVGDLGGGRRRGAGDGAEGVDNEDGGRVRVNDPAAVDARDLGRAGVVVDDAALAGARAGDDLDDNVVKEVVGGAGAGVEGDRAGGAGLGGTSAGAQVAEDVAGRALSVGAGQRR